MCMISMKSEPCSHPECVIFYSYMASGKLPQFSNPSVDQISTIVEQQNYLLSQIAENNAEINTCLDKIIHQTEGFSGNFQPEISEDVFSVEQIFNWAPEDSNYYLQLESMFPSPIFKERGFSLSFSARNELGDPVYIPQFPSFRVVLFTMDPCPRHLKQNISGKKILRGSTQAEISQEGYVRFPNIVINEVTSHYSNDSFYFVVANSNPKAVKPFILSNVSVRARKPKKTESNSSS